MNYNFHLTNKTIALLMAESIAPEDLLDKAQKELDDLGLTDPFAFVLHTIDVGPLNFMLVPGESKTEGSVGILPVKWRKLPLPENLKAAIGSTSLGMTIQWPEPDFDEEVLN